MVDRTLDKIDLCNLKKNETIDGYQENPTRAWK